LFSPATESAELILSGTGDSQLLLTVTNVLGKDVYVENRKFINGEKMKLDLTGFSKGVYLVTVKSNDINKTTRLIIQ
jgi:Secretion system C-terminal sorting domain